MSATGEGATDSEAAADDERVFAFKSNLVVAASAGTGKTHRLTTLYVLLVLGLTSRGRRDAHEAAPPLLPDRILATTFSRAAAAEIGQRVERALRALADAGLDDGPVADVIRRRHERLGLAVDEGELGRRARRALDRWHGARIDTLHGAAGALVRAHAVELGVAPGARILEEDEADALCEVAVRDALAAALEGDAPGATGARTLVSACGSVANARREVARLLERLDEEGLDVDALALPDHLAEARALGLSLVRVARACAAGGSATLRDPAARLAVELGGWARCLAGDLAPFPASAVGPLGDLLAVRRPTRTKCTEADLAFVELLEALPGESKSDKARRAAALLGDAPALAPRERALVAVLNEARRRLMAARRRAGGLSFGDLLRLARDGLRDRPAMAREARAATDVLLVDEFQDTSRVQRDLVYLLRERDDAAASRRPGALPRATDLEPSGLLVVGDRKQSIYAFRGADVAVFSEICADLAGAAAGRALGLAPTLWSDEAPAVADFVALRESRRSGPALLAVVNAFAERDFGGDGEAPREFDVRYGRAERLVAAPAPTRVRDDVVLVSDDGAAPAGAAPLVASAAGPLREALVAAAWIAGAVAGGADDPARLAYRDVAVLARRRSTLPLVELGLARLGVPYVVAGRALYDASEVRDLAAVLRLLLDPRDRLALATVLRGPMCGLSDAALALLATPERGLSLPLPWPWPGTRLRDARRDAVARLPVDDGRRLDALRTTFVALRRAVLRLPPAEALRAVVERFDLDRALAALPRSAQRLGNVDRLVGLARRRGGTLAAFSRWLDVRIADESDEAEAAVFARDDDAVRLLTIHASKGLDFPVVVLLDLDAAPQVRMPGLALVPPGPSQLATLVVRHVARLPSDDPSLPAEPVSLTTAAATRARDEAKRRELAERRRLTYVAMTRARERLVLVRPVGPPRGGSAHATLAAALSDPHLPSLLGGDVAATELLERAEVLAGSTPGASAHLTSTEAGRPTEPGHDERPADADPRAPSRPERSAVRHLSIATTPLSVFRGCPRRFRLRHLLGLDEPVASGQLDLFAPAGGDDETDARAVDDSVDPIQHGRAAHRVLERWPVSAWGEPAERAEIERRLTLEGLAPGGETTRIADAIARVLDGPYAARVRAAGAVLHREAPFVLPVPLGEASGAARPELALRGVMDLCVEWPDGSIDVVDYKRSRPRTDLSPYEFQLRAYALAAARSAKTGVRAGILFLGSGVEPLFLTGGGGEALLGADDHDRFEAEIAEVAERLLAAQWADRWDGVTVDRCKAMHCGFVVACHGRSAGAPA